MRPTGELHLGHYHGVLKNWVELQNSYECFFFVADWHALTTHYEDTTGIEDHVFNMVVDWLACGIDPGGATLFVQSQVEEHAELFLLLSMITPQSWLERIPSYKNQQIKLQDRDLTTYGFLGYPLLQSADVLAYRAGFVPVGEDQVAHIELTREIARRFNHIFGRDKDFVEKAEEAINKMGKKNARIYRELCKKIQEQGDDEAIGVAQALVESQQNLSLGDQERLLGYLSGGGRVLLPEPQVLLTKISRVPGTDGEKMSKSYANTITLRESNESIEKKIRSMMTDPARAKRTDPGTPEKCPVWQLHQLYSNDSVRDWVQQGCTTASIGCLECKQPIIDAIQEEITPIREQALEYMQDKPTILKIIAEGNEVARGVANDTLDEIRSAMGLVYRQ